jgi:hypothetical protein
MSRRTILGSALVGLGSMGILWAALAARAEPEPKAARAVSRSPKARKADPMFEAPSPVQDSPQPDATASTAPIEIGDGNAAVRERIRRMEDRLLELELRRNALTEGNQTLEQQIQTKSAEAWAGRMAEWRVRALEFLLGLTDAQKQSLLELWTKWLKEDAGRPAGRETWLSREVDLRSRLSVEQAAKLQDSVSAQSRQMWTNLGGTIGGMIGASREEQSRFQQMLGDYRAPNSMLLPEGYGADWPGMLKEASGRLRPALTPELSAKLDRLVQR